MRGILNLWRWFKRLRALTLILLFLSFALTLSAYTLLNTNTVQQFVAGKILHFFSNKYGTEVSLGKIELKLFNRVVLHDFYLEDMEGDTLIFAREMELRIGRYRPFKNLLKVDKLGLYGADIVFRKRAGEEKNNLAQLFAKSQENNGMDSIAVITFTDGEGEIGVEQRKGIAIHINSLEIKDSRFRSLNEDKYSDLDINIPLTNFKIREINMKTQTIHAREASLEAVHVAVIKHLYPNENPEKEQRYDTSHLNTKDWKFLVDDLEIFEGGFLLRNYNKELRLSGMDFNNLSVSGINLKATDSHFIGDTISSLIKGLSAKDQCGFELDRLSAVFRMTPHEISLNDLILETPESRISNQLELSFATLHGFERFVTDVRITGDFERSKLHTHDLAYFAPGASVIDESFALDGKINGTVSNLKGQDLSLRFGKDSEFKGDFSLRGLPDITETYIDFNIDKLQSETPYLRDLLKEFSLPESIDNFGSISFTGQFTGFVRDFVAYGQLKTDIGNISSDINMKIDEDPALSKYKGRLSLITLDLGKFTSNVGKIGTISMEGNIEGQGLNLESATARLDAYASQFELNGYDYQEISFDGNLRKGFIDGELDVNDENFKQHFIGTVDITGPLPHFDFYARIDKMALKALNLYEEEIDLQANLALNITGDNIDNIVGNGGIYDLQLFVKDDLYLLDSLVLNSSEQDGVKDLSVYSELFNATFNGQFQLSQIPVTIKNIIGTYFPESGLLSLDTIPSQDLSFSVNIVDSKNFTGLLGLGLDSIRNATISGDLKSISSQFSVRARVPDITLNSVRLDDLLVDVRTENDKLRVFTRTDHIHFSDAFMSPLTVLEGDYSRDSLFFNLKIGKDTDSERLNLNGALASADSSFTISILPSEIYIENDHWKVEPNNSIVYNYKNLIARNFELRNGEQRLRLSSLPNPEYKSFLQLDLENVELGHISKIANLSGIDLKGKVSGTFNAGDIFQEASYLGILSVNDFALNDEEIGDIQISASMLARDKKLKFNTRVSGNYSLIANGVYDPFQDDEIFVALDISKAPLGVLERVTGKTLDQIAGYASGKLDLSGTIKKPDLDGEIKINDGNVRVITLNTSYNLPEAPITFKDNRIEITESSLYDKLGNEGKVWGTIYHDHLKDWSFNTLNITTSNLLLMETTMSTNPEFYGKALGSGQVEFVGPVKDLDITVRAESKKGTHIIIPITNQAKVAQLDYISFMKPPSEDENPVTEEEDKSSNVNFNFFFDVTPDAEVELILDNQNGDRIRGRGYGNLLLEINTLGKFKMYGSYNISEGNYSFSLQNIVNKIFEIEKGGTIAWKTGDPFAAELDISAIYRLRAAKIDLIPEESWATLTDAELNDARRREPIDVYLNLTGMLEAPNIDFNIKTPENEGRVVSSFDRKLNELKQDENELNKQVFGLLILNRFIPEQISTTPLLSSVNTTVSEFLSNQLSVYLSDWVSVFLTDVDIDINYRPYEITGNLTDLQPEDYWRQELNVALIKRFYDDRISVNVGGNFDFGQNATSSPDLANASNIAGDFEVEYAITPDRRLRIKMFRKSQFDIIEDRRDNKTGIGLFYRKEFDKLGDLWQSRVTPDGKEEDEIIPTP